MTLKECIKKEDFILYLKHRCETDSGVKKREDHAYNVAVEMCKLSPACNDLFMGSSGLVKALKVYLDRMAGVCDYDLFSTPTRSPTAADWLNARNTETRPSAASELPRATRAPSSSLAAVAQALGHYHQATQIRATSVQATSVRVTLPGTVDEELEFVEEEN